MDEPGLMTYPYVHVQSGHWPSRLMMLTYMCSEQLWDKQYQITNQYLDQFSRNLYFVALGVGVSVCIKECSISNFLYGIIKCNFIFSVSIHKYALVVLYL